MCEHIKIEIYVQKYEGDKFFICSECGETVDTDKIVETYNDLARANRMIGILTNELAKVTNDRKDRK